MKIEEVFKFNLKKLEANYYFIACSGGVDSMVLLHLALKFNLKVHVLHVNYNLRGDDSIQDAQFIKQYCENRKIPITIQQVLLKQQLIDAGGNLQNEARKIRYDFFEKQLNTFSESKLLVGHHLDDQIETFWLQLYRGSGLKGLTAMNIEQNRIIRPLLQLNKAHIIEYAKKNNMSWREDASNLQSDYQRNKWRNQYLPFLRSEIETIDKSVILLQKIFQQNLEIITERVREIADKIRMIGFIRDSEINSFELVDYVELFRILEIPANRIIPFINLFPSQKGSKIQWQNEFEEEFEIIREKDGFYFNLKKVQSELPSLKIELVNELPDQFDKHTFFFAPKKLKGELCIRFWKKGDRIYPIGINGSKLISDVITDAKIPNSERKKQLVICDENKILACVGLCIDRRAIANKEFPVIKVSLKN